MRYYQSRHLLAGVAMALCFLPLWAFVPTHYLFDFVNALAVSVGVGVLFAYGSGILRSFREPKWTGANYLVLGIAATWMAMTVRHLWNWVWRFMDKPDAMIDHPFVAFLVWLAIMGGVLHLAAKGAIEGDIPRENWIRLGVAVAIGLAMGTMVIVFLEPSMPIEAQVPPRQGPAPSSGSGANFPWPIFPIP